MTTFPSIPAPSLPGQAAQADRAYAALIARTPQRALAPAAEAEIRAWAEERLGSARLVPWLRLWSAVHGRFQPGWLPDSYLARHVLPGLQGAAGRRLGASRTLTRRILGTSLMPDRAYRVRGFWLDRAGRPLAEDRAEKVAFGRARTVLLRRDSAPRGQALSRIDRACFARETATAGDLTVIGLGPQDPAIEALAPGSAALLRLVTLKPGGSAARLAGSLLRLGRVGHALPRPGHEITLPVDAGTGRVSGPGLLPDWSRSAIHPDSGAPFEGLALAGHAEAVEACRALHDRVPHLTLVAWDLALEAGGKPRLIDWEVTAPETGALQALSGAVFAGLGWEDLWRATAPPAPLIPARAPARPKLSVVPDPGPAPAPAPESVSRAAPPDPVAAAPAAPAQPPVQPVRPRRPILPRALRRRA